jgi:CopG family nickel-responsive transcriptional regulator
MNKVPRKEKMVRFGVSMESSLVSYLDKWVGTKHSNRSESIRSLIRHELSENAWKSGGTVVAVISLVYDHHKPDLLRKLSHLEHEHSDLIISAQHVHLDHNHCLEVIITRGKTDRLSELTDKLRAFKGVKRAALSAIGLPHAATHAHPG